MPPEKNCSCKEKKKKTCTCTFTFIKVDLFTYELFLALKQENAKHLSSEELRKNKKFSSSCN